MESDRKAGAGGEPEAQDVEDLLVEALGHLEAEGDAGLARFLAEHSERASEIRGHLERLGRMGLAQAARSESERAFPERLGDFLLLEPLGQGGMGVVYRARQESLDREVALKLIRSEQLYFPGARERFRREVEIVARMQHPGIVPIYAVGTDEGVPYFAMELVHGATLGDVLAELQGADAQSLEGADLDRILARRAGSGGERELAPLFRGPWVSVVLRILREVAEALEHAHRRGVLHRDVKPSNVMITRAGRVLLLDFGLSSATGDERLTRSGSQLGSLAYMSPERLSGEIASLDARADVYSLGATLWELLTLRLPYSASDPVRLRELALAAARPRLATLNPAVSWEIETICATALEPDRERRYASAALFAHDLDNVLGHRPILARRASAPLRLRRWAQRHPVRATAFGALALALLVGPSAFGWQEWRARSAIAAQRDALALANKELEIARDRALEQTMRAQKNFTKLQEAVDTMLARVGDESLRDIPRMEKVRRDLLTEAVRFYGDFLAEHPDDPELRGEAAEIQARTARVHTMLGDYASAERDLLASMRTRAELVSEAADLSAAELSSEVPDRSAHDYELACNESMLANIQRLTGRLGEARATIDRAIERWQQLAGDWDGALVAEELGLARLERSLVLSDSGDLAGAVAELEQSVQELEPICASRAEDQELSLVLGRTLDRLGVDLYQQGWQEARGGDVTLGRRATMLHRRARELWAALRMQRPEDTQARVDAARNTGFLGVVLYSLGDHEEALDSLRDSVEAFEALARDFPLNPRHRAEAAMARNNMGAAHGMAGRTDESLAEYEKAADLWEGACAGWPEADEYFLSLGSSLQGIAAGHLEERRFERAADALRRSAEAVDRALLARPENPTHRRVRRLVWRTEARLELEQGQHAAAARAVHHMLLDEIGPPEPLPAAALLGNCISHAETDESLPSSERLALADAYREAAFQLLFEAVRMGTTLEDIRDDVSLADLRSQPGFAELLEDLEREAQGGI